jgi:hypothetical protein
MLELLNLPIKCAFFTVTARPVNWNLASKKKETFTALDVVQMHSRHMIWIFVFIASLHILNHHRQTAYQVELGFLCC